MFATVDSLLLLLIEQLLT